jgi:hypothetical protein
MAKARDVAAEVARLATRHDGVTVGVACAGTAVESRTYRVGDKAFLFVGKRDLRFKLDGSVAAATAAGVDVGKGGWAKLSIESGRLPRQLDAWIAESYQLMAPPAVVTVVSKPRRQAAAPSGRTAKTAARRRSRPAND